MFTRSILKNQLRPALEKALAAADLPPGISVKLGSASFSDVEATFKLVATLSGTDGVPLMSDSDKWALSTITKLPQEEMQGLQITIQGKRFTVTGYNGRAYKNPIELLGPDGRGARCPESTLISCLTRDGRMERRTPGSSPSVPGK